jgi:uncharacterized protein (DUF952 family)
MAIVYHITRQQDWESALESGAYQSPTLAKDGFIHCSTDTQVLRVANNFYRGQTETGQPEPEIQELFPHVYGAINLGAVIKMVPFPPQPDGTFVFPQI